MSSVILVPFHGPGTGVGDLSWGQREIWSAMQAQESSLAGGSVAPMPDGKGLDYAAAAHETTRPAADGTGPDVCFVITQRGVASNSMTRCSTGCSRITRVTLAPCSICSTRWTARHSPRSDE